MEASRKMTTCVGIMRPGEGGSCAMLMFSGLEAQGEINRLLDELYGERGRASLGETEERRTPKGL